MNDQSQTKPKRLLSIDVLRGFDMFFIIGGADLICRALVASGKCGCWLERQMHHVSWQGLAHHDTIFPLFLFLAGVAWPFSLASQEAKGATPWQIHRKLLVRVAILFAIGLSFGGILRWSPNFRLMSVLGFIALSWGIAALVFYHVRNIWGRLAVLGGLVLGYFAILHFGAFPGIPAGVSQYTKEWNVIRWLDVNVYPNHLMIPAVAGVKAVPYEPESLFSVPGGVVIALLGMFAGTVLRVTAWSGGKKLGILALCSLGSYGLYWLFYGVLGVWTVKALWTVSFIFATATYSFGMLALFYLVIDVLGLRKWGVLFDPIGKNSILSYFIMMTGVTGTLSWYLMRGWVEHTEDANWKRAVSSLGCILVCWIVTRFLQKKNVFLKV